MPLLVLHKINYTRKFNQKEQSPSTEMEYVLVAITFTHIASGECRLSVKSTEVFPMNALLKASKTDPKQKTKSPKQNLQKKISKTDKI